VRQGSLAHLYQATDRYRYADCFIAAQTSKSGGTLLAGVQGRWERQGPNGKKKAAAAEEPFCGAFST
jgi:hypothetical protein